MVIRHGLNLSVSVSGEDWPADWTQNAWTELNLVSEIIFHLTFHYPFFSHVNITNKIEEANGIGGEIPTEIEQLNLLRFLYLEGAKNRDQYFSGNGDLLLRGTIPPEVATMSELTILDLNFNLLEGQVRYLVHRNIFL